MGGRLDYPFYRRLQWCVAATSLLLACTGTAEAQVKVGNNIAVTAPSAAFEIESTTKGFLPPRMTQAQLTAIASPALGLLVFCTDCTPVGLQFYTGAAWAALGAAAAQAATLTANTLACSGTLSGTYQQGTAMTGANTKQVTLGVTAGGAYSVQTDTVNGISFAGSGTTSTIGTNTFILRAFGTPGAAGSFTYSTSVNGQPPCSFSVTFGTQATFSCSSTTNTLPTALTTGQSYTGTVTEPYTAGNAAAYPATTVGPIKGLTLTRTAGTYGSNGGNVVYNLSGTYTGINGGSVAFTLPESGCTVLAGIATYTAGTLNCSGALNGTYQQSGATTTSNTKTVTVTVATTGGYNASTNTVNGVSFSSADAFSSTGSQTVVLTASGTPVATGSFTYTVSLGGQTCTFSVPYTAAATFACGSATNSFSPSGALVNGQSYSGTYTLPYTAGNGQSYGSVAVGPTNGLTLTRTANTYASNGGNVVYTLSGTYTGSGSSQLFTLPEGCTVSVGVSMVTTLAGSTQGYTDGTGTAAQFNQLQGIAVDGSGNMYVADQGNQRIRKITAAGVVSTLTGGAQGFADGTGTAAQFSNPSGVAVDASGNVYVADGGNNRIRKVTAAGVVTTLAGSGAAGYADGTGTAAQFSNPTGIAIDASGTLYVADQGNARIRKITAAGVVTSLAGSGGNGYADGTGTAAQFSGPRGIAVDGSGLIYVAELYNNRIRKVTSTGIVTTFAGSGTQGYADGTGTAAQFYSPSGLAVDASGTVYVADQYNNRIRKITAAGVVTTFAGNGTYGSVDGTPATAQFGNPPGVAVDASGNLYVTDYSNYRVRKITP